MFACEGCSIRSTAATFFFARRLFRAQDNIFFELLKRASFCCLSFSRIEARSRLARISLGWIVRRAPAVPSDRFMMYSVETMVVKKEQCALDSNTR